MPIIVGVNSPELAAIAGTHADGVNVRLSSPTAENHLAVARDAARARAEGLELDRLVLARYGSLGP